MLFVLLRDDFLFRVGANIENAKLHAVFCMNKADQSKFCVNGKGKKRAHNNVITVFATQFSECIDYKVPEPTCAECYSEPGLHYCAPKIWSAYGKYVKYGNALA